MVSPLEVMERQEVSKVKKKEKKKDAWDARHVRDSFTIQKLVYVPDELLL